MGNWLMATIVVLHTIASLYRLTMVHTMVLLNQGLMVVE